MAVEAARRRTSKAALIREFVRERLGHGKPAAPDPMADLIGDIDDEAGDIDSVVYGGRGSSTRRSGWGCASGVTPGMSPPAGSGRQERAPCSPPTSSSGKPGPSSAERLATPGRSSSSMPSLGSETLPRRTHRQRSRRRCLALAKTTRRADVLLRGRDQLRSDAKAPAPSRPRLRRRLRRRRLCGSPPHRLRSQRGTGGGPESWPVDVDKVEGIRPRRRQRPAQVLAIAPTLKSPSGSASGANRTGSRYPTAGRWSRPLHPPAGHGRMAPPFSDRPHDDGECRTGASDGSASNVVESQHDGWTSPTSFESDGGRGERRKGPRRGRLRPFSGRKRPRPGRGCSRGPGGGARPVGRSACHRERASQTSMIVKIRAAGGISSPWRRRG